MRNYIKFFNEFIKSPLVSDDLLTFHIYERNINILTSIKIQRKQIVSDEFNNPVDISKIINNFTRDKKASQKNLNNPIQFWGSLAFFDLPIYIEWKITSKNIETIITEDDIHTSQIKIESYKTKTLNLIKEKKQVSLTEITILNHYLSPDARKNIIKELVDEGEIYLAFDTSAGRQKRMYKATNE
jgi:hypothetical protein